ncbi:MAG: MoaD/ThiS family protein [Actinomycetota bacterium]|nr:MoaD/ThiS family protein [Actinomycetota bacterium]
MSISVRIPTPLRSVTKGVSEVQAAGVTVGEVIADLEKQFPGMGDRLRDESGAIRRFVNIYVGDEDIRFLKGLETPVTEGSQVSIIPAVAGG